MLRARAVSLGVLTAAALALGGCSSVPLLLATLDPDRIYANSKAEGLCKQDAGVMVYEKVETPAGLFPTLVPDNRTLGSPRQGNIFEVYRFAESREYIPTKGDFRVTRVRGAITRIADGKVLGEYVWYMSPGEPGLKSVSCYEGNTESNLIAAVFQVPGDPPPENGRYPTCPGSDRPKTTAALEASWQFGALGNVPKHQIARRPKERYASCDNLTQIDSWYDTTGKNSVGLVGTRLLFAGADGHRCQALAMRFPLSITCSASGIEVFGHGKTGGSALVQRYSPEGQLLSELEFRGVAPPTSSGGLLGYKETATKVKIVSTAYQRGEPYGCYWATAPKPSPERLGPPDTGSVTPICLPMGDE
jgi:hypothetical protein